LDVVFLDKEQILGLYEIIKKRAEDNGLGGGPYGIMDEAKLDASIHRPQQSFNDQYLWPTIYHKAAALAHSFINNHPFLNGNKRIALLAAASFLRLNGYQLSISDEEIDMLGDMFESTAEMLNTIYNETPDIFVAFQYVRDVCALAHVFADDNDPEITMDNQRGVSFDYPLNVDCSTQDIIHFNATKSLGSMRLAACSIADGLSEFASYLTLNNITLGTTCVVDASGSLNVHISDDILVIIESHVEYGDLIIADLMYGTNLTNLNVNLHERLTELTKYKNTSFPFLNWPNVTDDCLIVMSKIQAIRAQYQQHPIGICDKDGKFELLFEVTVRPLWVFEEQGHASFTTFAKALLKSHHPDTDEVDFDELSRDFALRMRALFDEASSAMIVVLEQAIMSAMFCNGYDFGEIDFDSDESRDLIRAKYEDFLEEIEQRSAKGLPSLVESTGVSQPEVESLWAFLVEVCEKKMEVDAIAAWLEEHTTEVAE